jgi:hypothetical protein
MLSTEIQPSAARTQSTLQSENFPAVPQTMPTLASEIFPSVPGNSQTQGSESLHSSSAGDAHGPESRQKRNRPKPRINLETQIPAQILNPPLVSSPGVISSPSRTLSADYLNHRGGRPSTSTRRIVTPSPQRNVSDDEGLINNPQNIPDNLWTNQRGANLQSPLASRPLVSERRNVGGSHPGTFSTLPSSLSSATPDRRTGMSLEEEFAAFVLWRQSHVGFLVLLTRI